MTTGKKPEPARESPELIKLRAEADALKKEADRLKEIAGRAQADLLNAKDRLERDRQEVSKFALAGAVTRLLPTLDNLQRAFLHLPEDLKNHEWVKGIVAIEGELMRLLGDLGLRKIEALGQPLDPARHEVLQTGPGEAGKVIEVFEEGYELNGRVLRPVKVRVGSEERQEGQRGQEGAAAQGETK
jgi:molecular chaperone GrpE